MSAISAISPNTPFIETSRYRLRELLGAGAMGAVYRATDRLEGRDVALKVVNLPGDPAQAGQESSNRDLHLSLAREFQTLASLRHPNLVAVRDYGFDRLRRPYFAMNLVPGARHFVEAARALPHVGRVHLLIDLLSSLSYIHRRGVIHRDLKPSNVLVDSMGTLKLVDFGLAIDTIQASTARVLTDAAGTLSYMAPELFMGMPASAASDLYAVGVLAYEVFAGNHPFEAPHIAALLQQILNRPPDLRRLDENMVEVIGCLLDKQSDRRYASAEAAILALCEATQVPHPPESVEVRESFLRASMFVGREAELDRLRRALGAAMEGSGSLWLVAGEAGVGKSRLLDELRTRALVQGALVVRGQASAEGGRSHQLWRDVLRRLVLSTPLNDLEVSILKAVVPEIGLLLERDLPDAPEVDGRIAQQRLTLTIVDVLKRQDRPLVILLEDLQWAGVGLEPLKQLGLFLGQFPWLIIGSYRDDEAPDLPAHLTSASVLRLPRLGEAEAAALCGAMLGTPGQQAPVIDLVWRETEGNTLFMVEVVRALAESAGALDKISPESLPPSLFVGGVRQVLRRRINRAPDWARTPLTLAAVIGRQIDRRLMEASGLDVDWESWLTVCANCAVLESVDGCWQFAHDRLREALLPIEADERRALHFAAAQAYETAYGADPAYAAVLADQWYEAGETARSVDYTLGAGDHLVLTLVDPLRARQLFERALTLTSKPHQRALLFRMLGDMSVAQGLLAEAQQHFRSALESGENDPVVVAAAENGLAQALLRLGDYEAARAAVDRAIQAVAVVGDAKLLTRAKQALAVICLYQGEFDTAHALLNELLALCETTRDLRNLASVHNNLGILGSEQGRFEEAQTHFEQGLALFQTLGDRAATGSLLNNLGLVMMDRGLLDSACDYFERSLHTRESIGDQRGIALAFNNLGEVHILRNEIPAAKTCFERALASARSLGDRRSMSLALVNLGGIAMEQGDLIAAADCLEKALARFRELGDRRGIVTALNNQAQLDIRAMRLPEARAALCESIALALGMESQPILLEALAGVAQVLIAAGDHRQAAELVGLAQNHPGASNMVRRTLITPLRDVQAELSPETLVAALERGRARDLAEAANALLKTLEDGQK